MIRVLDVFNLSSPTNCPISILKALRVEKTAKIPGLQDAVEYLIESGELAAIDLSNQLHLEVLSVHHFLVIYKTSIYFTFKGLASWIAANHLVEIRQPLAISCRFLA